MELIEIRRKILTAIAADDALVEILVLKGGNALELVHKIGGRASLDLDFSLAGDLDDLAEFQRRLFKSLHDRFDSAGFILFDETFGPRPTDRSPGTPWGGYACEFKIIPRELARALDGNLDRMRRQAQTIGPDQRRRFRIEISTFEFVGGAETAEVDGRTCRVYTLDMIAAEKLRAICQQSPRYPRRRNPTPRARDFYDIFVVVNQAGVEFSQPRMHDLVRAIFAAKEVDPRIIEGLAEEREFHRPDWPSVENAVQKELRSFDFYFDEVLAEVQPLQTLWIV